ncbi:neuronal acetylcholine receptor subunit non-alpha-3-like isoform X1 [Periplaneta americana]|uniref:neuronal acetylcholine receptor subunit non-alpha-3-like isoform X1 n=1 Tax=Periplaneta americana TaxID=6978 RepID=UPI0037E8E811
MLYLLSYSVVHAEDDCIENPTRKTETTRLKQDLLCDYDKTVRPVSHHSYDTVVSVNMLLRSISFDEHINSINIHCWMFWQWTDEHLRWNPDDYGGITSLNVNSDEIWVPEVAQFATTATWEVEVRMPSGRCDIKSKGYVMCAPGTVYFALCAPDLTYWPFDKVNCSLSLGAWMQSGEEINITIDEEAVDLFNYKPSRHWNLLSATARRHVERYGDNQTFPWIRYSFVLQRHSSMYQATVGVPALLYAVLVLTTFWLRHDGCNRLNLSCVTLLCHYLQLQYLGWMLHSNGNKCPLVVLFYRDSLALSGVSLVLTIIFRYLSSISAPPPAWVSRTTNWFTSFRLGQTLLSVKVSAEGAATVKPEGTEEEGSGLVELPPAEDSSGWSLLVRLLDRTCFAVYVVVYLFISIRCFT